MSGILAIQVPDLSAKHTFDVKMLAAIAPVADVLVNAATAFLTAELAHRFVFAKFGQVAVDTAFSVFTVPVDRAAKFLGGKLAIGILF